MFFFLFLLKSGHLQVARDRCTRRYLGGHVRRSILIGVAESSRVHEAEGVRIIEKQVEYRPRVEQGHLIQVAVLVLERLYVCGELGIVIVEGCRNCLDRSMPLFEKKRGTVRRRNCQEEERSRATVVQLFDLTVCVYISAHCAG